MSILYHSVEPDNVRDAYSEFHSVDFTLDYPERALKVNTVRLTGDVVYNDNNTAINGYCGAHSFIHSITTTFVDGSGMVEDIQYYNRLVKSKTEATHNPMDLTQASSVCELKFPEENPNHVLRLSRGGADEPSLSNQANQKADFSCKLENCLNNVLNSSTINSRGRIRVNIKLARNEEACKSLVNSNQTVSYTLSNLRLEFISVEKSDVEPAQLKFKTYQTLKSNVESALTVINARVAGNVRSISCNFQQQGRQNQVFDDEFETCALPSLTEVQLLFNDTTNNMYNYVLEELPEILENYKKSWLKATNHSSMTQRRMARGHGFGVGFDLGRYTETRDDKIQLQLRSGVDGSNKFNAYLFFTTAVEM